MRLLFCIRLTYNDHTLGETAQQRYIGPMDILAQTPTTERRFSVSERATARIAEIVASQPSRPALRVAVLAGGCSGFQYSFKLDTDRQPDDIEIQSGDIRVLVDQASLDLLGGAQLDYTEALMGAHFTVRNPNATAACGCGTSFSID